MFVHNINPVLINLGFIEIRYYGIVYAVGFLFILWYLLKKSAKKELSLSSDEVYDLVLWLIVGGIAGGRLFHIIAYEPAYYFSNLLEIFAIWNGGMAFHGGLIGAFIGMYLYCKKKKTNFYEVTDLIAIPFAFFLMLGRIANFLNGELYGRITNLPWAVKFPGASGFRHPSQLYESAKNLLIFGILIFFQKREHKKGYITWMFITLYGMLRFSIEFVREPTTLYFSVPAGQIFSLAMFLVGIMILWKNYWK